MDVVETECLSQHRSGSTWDSSNEIFRWASTCVMSASSSIFVAIFVFSYLVLHSIWLGCVSTTLKACCMCWKPPRFSNICHCHHIGPQGS